MSVLHSSAMAVSWVGTGSVSVISSLPELGLPHNEAQGSAVRLVVVRHQREERFGTDHVCVCVDLDGGPDAILALRLNHSYDSLTVDHCSTLSVSSMSSGV